MIGNFSKLLKYERRDREVSYAVITIDAVVELYAWLNDLGHSLLFLD